MVRDFHSRETRFMAIDVRGYDAFHLSDQLLTQPLRIIAGSRAGSSWFSHDAYRRARSRDKSLHIVEGATPISMYATLEFVKHAMAQLVPLYQNAGKSSSSSKFVGPLSAHAATNVAASAASAAQRACDQRKCDADNGRHRLSLLAARQSTACSTIPTRIRKQFFPAHARIEKGDQRMAKHETISPEEAADRLAIRELVEAYAHCADRRDAKGQMALFTADTHFEVYMDAKDPKPSQELHSREALAPVFADLNQYAATMHFLGQTIIHLLTRDRAAAETYCMPHHLTIDGGKRWLMIAALRYSDQFVKIDGAWLFSERRLYVDWIEERAL